MAPCTSNRYPLDKCWQSKPRYPRDSSLIGGLGLGSDQIVLVSSAILGFLSTGYGAASKVLSKHIIQCDTPASHLGIPRAPKKMELEIQSETGDEDQPEVDPEPENDTELEGLFTF